MSHITTHILDTSLGRPAAGVTVWLERIEHGEAREVARGTTDADGRLMALTPQPLAAGHYRLSADIGGYFRASGRDSLYRAAVLEIEIDGQPHYHLPLLIAPYSYSTYRGS